MSWSPPTGSAVALQTPTWRILTYGQASRPEHRLFVAAYPEDLCRAYEAVFPILDELRIDHRHARSSEVLEAYNAHPWWGGKAIIAEFVTEAELQRTAARLDAALVSARVSGPAGVAGAQPLPVASGLLFSRTTASTQQPAGDRRQRLAKLLSQ